MYPRCVTSHAKRAPVHRGRVKVQEEGKGVGKGGFIWAVADLRADAERDFATYRGTYRWPAMLD